MFCAELVSDLHSLSITVCRTLHMYSTHHRALCTCWVLILLLPLIIAVSFLEILQTWRHVIAHDTRKRSLVHTCNISCMIMQYGSLWHHIEQSHRADVTTKLLMITAVVQHKLQVWFCSCSSEKQAVRSSIAMCWKQNCCCQMQTVWKFAAYVWVVEAQFVEQGVHAKATRTSHKLQ